MGVTVEGKGAAAPENPLVPNRVLREMYRKMVETRLIGERQSKGRRAKAEGGHEACRVSLTQGLALSDLVLDSQPGGLMKYLLGMKLAQALAPPEKKNRSVPSRTKTVPTRVLPFVEGPEARLFAGLGTAMMQKRMKGTDLTVIFVGQQEVTAGGWRRALTLAAANHLPAIFVALPDLEESQHKTKDRVSSIALRCGLPGIPVEAGDVVALYRVAQEAIGRIRIGGGPVVIEAVPFQVHGKRGSPGSDPLLQLSEALLRRRAATRAWMSGVAKNFSARLVALRKG